MSRWLLVIGLVSLTLVGCSLLSPINTNKTKYVLSIHAEKFRRYKKRQKIILVMPTEAISTYNTQEMAYTDKANTIDYYSKNKWANKPAELLMPLIVEGLIKSNYFKGVLTPPQSGGYQYVLHTQILTLLQDYKSDPARAKFKLRYSLKNATTHQLIHSQVINDQAVILNKSPEGGVEALNVAVAKALKKMIHQIVQ